MKKEIKGSVIRDEYVCNAGFWTTDYHLVTDGKDLEDLLKEFDGKNVKITMEEIE